MSRPAQLLAWYDAIVAGVSALRGGTAGGRTPTAENPQAGYGVPPRCSHGGYRLRRAEHVRRDRARPRRKDRRCSRPRAELTVAEIVSNAAVLLFGGIETTEGMICNAIWYLLRDQAALRRCWPTAA